MRRCDDNNIDECDDNVELVMCVSEIYSNGIKQIFVKKSQQLNIKYKLKYDSSIILV